MGKGLDMLETSEPSVDGLWGTVKEAKSPLERSHACHKLMDVAERSGNLELWENIGRHFIELLERDDLSPEVSDHYVRQCPDEAFIVIAQIWTRRKPFAGWICRRDNLRRVETRQAEERRQRERRLWKRHRH